MAEYHGKIVHTTGSIGRRGVAQGKICRSCPGGCKTDCLRAGVVYELDKKGVYDFNSFGKTDFEYDDVDEFDDF